MDLEKRYKTVEGVECNILQLVKMEPEWAANRIQQGEKAEAALKLVEGQKPSTNNEKPKCLCGREAIICHCQQCFNKLGSHKVYSTR